MSTNDIKMNKIGSVGLHFAKKSDDFTWNDPELDELVFIYTTL